MTEKNKLLNDLIEKSKKSKEEIDKLVVEKVDELSGLVSEEGAIYIVANDLGIRLDSEKPKKEADLVKIEEITEPKTPVSLVCKVIRKYDRVEFNSTKSEGSVQSILVGDETGIIRIVFWNEKTEILENIQDGDILKITNAYTRENTNSQRIEINYSSYSDIEVKPEGVEIELKEFTPTDIEFTEKKISELEEGDRNVKVKGIITDFDIPRFYLACPECFKKVLQDEGIYKCNQHEEVTALKVPIVNMIIDDGSSTINLVGFRDRAEELTKFTTDEILALAENVDKYNQFSKNIIGSSVELGGNIGSNNMTGEKQILVNQVLNIEIKSVEKIADDLIKENSTEKQRDTINKSNDDDDELDVDIEDIDLDDDLL